MRKLVLVGLLLAGTLFVIGGTSGPASAWCYRGFGYASPAYGYGYSPWLSRSYYAPRFAYGAAFYRPQSLGLARLGVSGLGMGRTALGWLATLVVGLLVHADGPGFERA